MKQFFKIRRLLCVFVVVLIGCSSSSSSDNIETPSDNVPTSPSNGNNLSSVDTTLSGTSWAYKKTGMICYDFRITFGTSDNSVVVKKTIIINKDIQSEEKKGFYTVNGSIVYITLEGEEKKEFVLDENKSMAVYDEITYFKMPKILLDKYIK